MELEKLAGFEFINTVSNMSTKKKKRDLGILYPNIY